MTDVWHLPFGRVLDSEVPGWPPDRAMARQTYIAMVRSRLTQLGWTQHDLATRLHTSDAFVSAVLTPLAEILPRDFRTLPLNLGIDIAVLLWPRAEQRELFRELVVTAASADSLSISSTSPGRTLRSGMLVDAVLADVRAFHSAASFPADPAVARLAYHQLWEASSVAVSMISPTAHAAAFAEALMLLHDAACILNRADVALLCAHRAMVALKEFSGHARARERIESLKVNAARAETVALNNLGNPAAALLVANDIEEHSYGYQQQHEFWAPQVSGDRLSSFGRMAGRRRFSVREAHRIYDGGQAALDGSPLSRALLDNAFARALIAHGTPPSLQAAEHLVGQGVSHARSSAQWLGPLHRAILLRTAARYTLRTSGENAKWRSLLDECRAIINSARLTHQGSELDVENAQIPRA